MIVGIGTDLLHIPRIKALIAKRGAPTLARRILSPRELTEFKALIRGKLDKAEAQQAEKNGNKDNVERTSFRTVLKGLNRNIENDAVTRFLASRWAAKEAAYKALYPLYVTPSSSSSSQTSSASPSLLSPSSSSYTSNSSLKPFDVLPTRTPSSPSPTSSSSTSSRTPTPGTSDPSTPLTPNLNWKSVDLHYINSKPHLRYTYGYGQRNDLERDSHERKIRMPRLFVSLSHDGDYVSAVVIAEEEGGGSGSSGGGGSGKGASGSGKGDKGGVIVTEYR